MDFSESDAREMLRLIEKLRADEYQRSLAEEMQRFRLRPQQTVETDTDDAR